jgi:selenocysteine lyase/cysteine desulfurase
MRSPRSLPAEHHAERFPGVMAAKHDGRVLADNGAGTQLPREALDAVARYLEHDNARKGAPFARNLRVSALIADAKDAFADLLGVPHGTIGLGLNATSIAFGLARSLAHTIRPGDRVVVTDSDHYGNVVPWSWLSRFGAEIVHVGVDAHGELNEHAFAEALGGEPVLVALPWASNGTGNVFDVARLSAAAKEAGAIVVVDGVQAAPHLRLDVPGTVDAVFFSAYKIYAPHFGAWYAHPDFARRFFTADDPLIPSAPFHWSMETGTQNHEGLAGWLGTIAYLRSIGDGNVRLAMDRIAAGERELTRYALRAFADRTERVVLYGRNSEEDRLPVFAFNVRGESPDTMACALDEALIEANVGNFYSPRLLNSLTPETSGNAVRLSFAHYNDSRDIDRCFAVIDTVIARRGHVGVIASPS